MYSYYGNPRTEKRRSPRVYWILPEVEVTIISPQSELRIEGWIQDISQLGFKLRAKIPQKIGRTFRERDEIRFETSEEFFGLRGQGKIIWISADHDLAGIMIQHMDEKSSKCLFGFLGLLPSPYSQIP